MINFKNWDDPTNTKRNEIVFAGRNLEYGAYTIRKNYNGNIVKAFSSSLFFVVAVFTGPYIYSFFKSAGEVKAYREIVVDLQPVKPKDKETVIKQKEIVKTTNNNSGGKSSSIPVVSDTTSNDTLSVVFQDLEITGDGKDTTSGIGLFAGDVDTTDYTQPVIFAEVMPEFPGGQDALLRFLSSNIRYPAAARENGVEGTVYINFIIDKDGWVKSPTLKRGISGGCSDEALRVISKMPQWSPGMINKHAVNVQFVIPVKFRLE